MITKSSVSRCVLGALVAGALTLAACKDEPKPAPATPSATPSAASLPSASAKPELEVVKPKPAKKLEDCPKGTTVKFDNPDIEQAVRFKLQKTTGRITKAELGKLSSLNLSQVEGLEELDICLFAHTTGLKELFLGRGQIRDISPLAGLVQLESLRASMNPFSDLTPLAEMNKMDRLDLGLTRVKDLTPLSGLTSLTELQLDDTPVEDVSPLAKLTKLERLSLQRTRVKDFSPLKTLTALKFLYVKDSPGEFDAAGQLASLAQGGLRIMTD
jgi:internalin A